MLPEIPNEFERLIKAQRGELSKEELALLQKLIAAYAVFYKDIEIYIVALTRLIEDNPALTSSAMLRAIEYTGFMTAIDKGINQFGDYAKVTINLAAVSAAELAYKHISQMGIEKLDSMFFLQELLRPEGKLMERIDLWAPYVKDKVRESILTGVKLGRNPRKIAADMRKSLGVGLNEALRTTRTAQLWSYREATRANYMASSVVTGWIWMAARDDRTCMSCLNMDGTIHPLTEPLNDHHNGRCVMIPYPQGQGWFDSNGVAKDWFDKQSEEFQSKSMGKEKHAAYKDGLFTFDKLTTTYEDAVYGVMRSETALKDLING